MLRLIFCTASIIPIALIPWVTTKARPVPETRAAGVMDQAIGPDIAALTNCEVSEVPVFFHDVLITSHSADAINSSLITASHCGPVTVTIVPVLPDYADGADAEQADLRATELVAYVDDVADRVSDDLSIEMVNPPIREDVSTLYINGRAAILRITPDGRVG